MGRGRRTKSGLTELEERFVEEFLIDRIGTSAYQRAHPAVKRSTAAVESCKLLTKPKIKQAIDIASKELQKSCKTSAEKEIRKLAMLANYDIGRAFDLSADQWVPLPPRQIPYEVRQAIVAVKVKRHRVSVPGGEDEVTVESVEFKFVDKLAARDKLMRHFGLYKDLPPLEVLLALLPPDLREPVRASLAASLLEGAGGSGNPAGGVPPGADAGEAEGGPAAADADGGADAGPVAGGARDVPGPAGGGPLHPPVGEDADGGGADPGPLLD